MVKQNSILLYKYFHYHTLKKKWLCTSIQIMNSNLFNNFNFCYLQHKNTIILNLKKTLMLINKQLNLLNLLTKKFYYPILLSSNYVYNTICYVNHKLPINFITEIKNNNLTNNYFCNLANLNLYNFNNNFIISLIGFTKPISVLLPVIGLQIKWTDYLINGKFNNFLFNYFYIKCLIFVLNNFFLCK